MISRSRNSILAYASTARSVIESPNDYPTRRLLPKYEVIHGGQVFSPLVRNRVKDDLNRGMRPAGPDLGFGGEPSAVITASGRVATGRGQKTFAQRGMIAAAGNRHWARSGDLHPARPNPRTDLRPAISEASPNQWRLDWAIPGYAVFSR